MNKAEQKNAFDKIMEHCGYILLGKGDDYALNDDRLSNFKVAGKIIGVRPEMQVLSLISTKVARLGTLLNGSNPATPANESVEDTIIDLINYSILLIMVREEQKEDMDTLKPGDVMKAGQVSYSTMDESKQVHRTREPWVKVVDPNREPFSGIGE